MCTYKLSRIIFIIVNILQSALQVLIDVYMSKIFKYYLFCNIFFLEISFCGMLFPPGGGGVTSEALKKFTDPGFFFAFPGTPCS